jgi:hypothetical protein
MAFSGAKSIKKGRELGKGMGGQKTELSFSASLGGAEILALPLP